MRAGRGVVRAGDRTRWALGHRPQTPLPHGLLWALLAGAPGSQLSGVEQQQHLWDCFWERGRRRSTRTGGGPGLPALTPGVGLWLQTRGLARLALQHPLTLGRVPLALLWGWACTQAAAGHVWVTFRIQDTHHHLLFPSKFPYSQLHTLVTRMSQVLKESGRTAPTSYRLLPEPFQGRVDVGKEAPAAHVPPVSLPAISASVPTLTRPPTALLQPPRPPGCRTPRQHTSPSRRAQGLRSHSPR